MRFNKLIMAGAIAISTVASAFSFNGDFNVGAGIGYYQTPTFPMEDAKGCDFTGGGFLGYGVGFNLLLPMALGIEYKAEVLESYMNVREEEDLFKYHITSYQHALDVYYKLGFLVGSIPMDLQFNLGLAMLNVLSESYKSYENGKFVSSEKEKMDRFGLGLHAGVRFNISMFYLGLDYIYMPTVSTGNGEWYNSKDAGMTSNKVNLSLGVIFNTGVLKSFTNK